MKRVFACQEEQSQQVPMTGAIGRRGRTETGSSRVSKARRGRRITGDGDATTQRFAEEATDPAGRLVAGNPESHGNGGDGLLTLPTAGAGSSPLPAPLHWNERLAYCLAASRREIFPFKE